MPALPSAPTVLWIVRFAELGHGATRIADELGIARPTVVRYLRSVLLRCASCMRRPPWVITGWTPARGLAAPVSAYGWRLAWWLRRGSPPRRTLHVLCPACSARELARKLDA